MNVGLPGTGIGGLFYLATALCMPLVEAIRTLRGRSSARRWGLVGAQAGLAAGILAGLWATAWTCERLFPGALASGVRTANDRTTHALGVTPTRFTLLTLGSLLVGVEALHLLLSASARLRRSLR